MSNKTEKRRRQRKNKTEKRKSGKRKMRGGETKTEEVKNPAPVKKTLWQNVISLFSKKPTDENKPTDPINLPNEENKEQIESNNQQTDASNQPTTGGKRRNKSSKK